jgi:hypothetical protein
MFAQSGQIRSAEDDPAIAGKEQEPTRADVKTKQDDDFGGRRTKERNRAVSHP